MPEQELIEQDAMLAPFDEVASVISKIQEDNENLVFDYEDQQGNKDARSHIAALRKVKTRIAEVHKYVKADALATCRAIDSKKKEYTAVIEGMINFHFLPLQEIQQREADEKAAEEKAIRDKAEAEEQARLAAIEKQEYDLAVKAAELKAKEDAVAAQNAEAERIIREAKIAEDAAKDARKRAKMEHEQADRNRIAREQAEKEKLAKAEKKRLEAAGHHEAITNEVVFMLTDYGMGVEDAKELTSKIASGAYPVVSINF